MNHPKPEEWVPYVYGDAPAPARRELAAHLRECPECRQEMEIWQRNINRLNNWKMPRVGRRHSASWAPFFQWAAAAVMMLGAGIWIGRATSPQADLGKLRAALVPQIRRELELETATVAREEAARAAALTLASSQRYTDRMGQQVYTVLKKEVDTLAVNAAAGLRNTAEQLVQLADYKELENTPNP